MARDTVNREEQGSQALSVPLREREPRRIQETIRHFGLHQTPQLSEGFTLALFDQKQPAFSRDPGRSPE